MRITIAFLAAVLTLGASIAEARWPNARIVFDEPAPMPAEPGDQDAVAMSDCDSCSTGCGHHVSGHSCRQSCGPRFGSNCRMCFEGPCGNCGRGVPCHGQWHHRIRGFCGFATVWSDCQTNGCESCKESDLQDSNPSPDVEPEAPKAPTEATKSVWRTKSRSF